MPVELVPGGINILLPVPGDVDLNGQVQAFDASLILKYLVGSVDLHHLQLRNANVSSDSTVSSLDATLILQHVVGIVDSLPADTSGGLFLASGEIGMEDQQIQAGEVIDLPLHLKNGNNILSMEGGIVFDPDQLRYTAITWSELLDDFAIQTFLTNGELRFAGAGTLPLGESFVIASLQFTVSNDFAGENATVTIESLRWNEGATRRNVATASLSLVTGVNEDQTNVPSQFFLYQNYPNPFNPSTKISYTIPIAEIVTLKIFDILGKEIQTLINEFQRQGTHSVDFNLNNISSGVYFYKLQVGDFVQTRKMLLMR